MRLFVAINFNNETHSQLLALCDELRKKSQCGNFTAPENLHLTLAFIGEVNPKQVGKIETILETVIFEPFEVMVDRLGTFSRGTLWYAGLRGNESLMLLQREITYKLVLCGFDMDGRKYSPHITLGREVATDAVPWKISPFGETVNALDLMKSERTNGRLTYTAIFGKRV